MTSVYWIGDNGDLWWHLWRCCLNTGPNCHNAGRMVKGTGVCVHTEQRNVRGKTVKDIRRADRGGRCILIFKKAAV